MDVAGDAIDVKYLALTNCELQMVSAKMYVQKFSPYKLNRFVAEHVKH